MLDLLLLFDLDGPLEAAAITGQSQLLKEAASGENGNGLQHGFDVHQLSRHINWYKSQGKHAEAKILQRIATNTILLEGMAQRNVSGSQHLCPPGWSHHSNPC